MTVNGELDLFSHTINPILGLIAIFMPILRRYRGRLNYARYYGALVVVVAIAYVWMHFEREYKWWESAWGVTFSTHTAVHVAILSALWQFSIRWRVAAVLIGFAYALLMVFRHYHAPSDIAVTAVAMLPELFLVWWIARPKRRLGGTPAGVRAASETTL
jgi:hypothetical protein